MHARAILCVWVWGVNFNLSLGSRHSTKLKSPNLIEHNTASELRITSRFIFAVLKIIVLTAIVYYGIVETNRGYLSALEQPPPEIQPPFQVELKPEAGAKWGDLKITLQPENAFVVGEPISTSIEIDPFLFINETATILIVFPESISILKEWEWANASRYEELVVLHAKGDWPDDTVRQDLTLWYVHEGVFGVNITMVRFEFQEMEKFCYPDIVHIKSYSYLEERRNAQLTNALNERIFGLTIIAVSPIAVTVVELMEQAYEALRKKSKNEMHAFGSA